MNSTALSTTLDASTLSIMEPTLADNLIREAESGEFVPQVGTARWANPILAGNAYPYEPGAIWLGRNPVNANQQMGYKDDRHVLLCAGSRTGKGRTMIINNLALWPGSICAIDPKGENATILANRRGQGSEYCDGLGQDVFVFDPFGCADVANDNRAFFDPISVMKADDPALPRKVARIAEAMTIIPEGDSAEWAKRGRQMIASVILHVVTSNLYEGTGDNGKKRRSIVTVRRLLTSGDMDNFNYLKESGIKTTSPMEVLWDAVAHNDAFEGIISDQGQSYLQSLQHHREYFESVRNSAVENTAWIDDPQMRETLIGSANIKNKFKPNLLKDSEHGQSIFLCLPIEDMPVYGRWQRTIIATILSEMQKTQGLPANNHPLLMCLDEFPALGTMERIEKAAAEIAGSGVKLMTVVQNLPQLKKLYKDSWETFLGNSGLHIYFGMDDNTTRGYLEKALGETEIIKHIRTENSGSSEQKTQGQTLGQSEGTTTGKSSGGSDTWQASQGTNKSRQSSHGRNESWGSSNSSGTSWNSGTSGGTGQSQNYGPSFMDFAYRMGGGKSSNSGWSQGQGGNNSFSTNQGGGTNFSEGTTVGKNQSTSEGGGTNWGETRGSSHQTNSSEQKSLSMGSQHGHSIAENVHKKPLLPSNEADKLFAPISDENHPAYPGMALIKIAGQDATFVVKANYDEDRAFIRCFDPNPAHPFIQVVEKPDLLPEPIVPRQPAKLEKKKFEATSKIDRKGHAVNCACSLNESYLQKPELGIEWQYEEVFTVDAPTEFIYNALLNTQYLPYWWQNRKTIGVDLPETIRPVTDLGYGINLVWCKKNKSILFYINSFIEYNFANIGNGKTELRVKYFQYNTHKPKSLFNLFKRAENRDEEELIRGRGEEERQAARNYLSVKKSSVTAFLETLYHYNVPIVPNTGKIFLPNLPSEERDEIFCLVSSVTSDEMRFRKDENGNPYLQEGRLFIDDPEIVYHMVDDESDEDCIEKYSYRYYLENCRVLKVFKQEGEPVEAHEPLALLEQIRNYTPDEMYSFGVKYLNEEGYLQAAAWFSKASESKHIPSMQKLGLLYEYGHGVSRKPSLAFQIYSDLKSIPDHDDEDDDCYVARMTAAESIAKLKSKHQKLEFNN